MIARAATLLGLAGLYLIFAGQVDVAESCVAVAAGLAGLGWSLAVLRCGPGPFGIEGPWLRAIGRALAAFLPRTVRVGVALLRSIATGRVSGGLTGQPFVRGGPEPEEAGRRALVVLAGSLAPDSYVISVEPDRLRLHALTPSQPRGDVRWPL